MSDSSVDRDFNTDRPQTFRVRDETFRIRNVRPEDYAAALRHAQETEDAADTTLEQMFALADERILLSLHPADGAHERWRKLRDLVDGGVSWADLEHIRDWLTEIHTGRPTRPATPSSTGRGNAGASSTATSSSPAVTRT